MTKVETTDCVIVEIYEIRKERAANSCALCTPQNLHLCVKMQFAAYMEWDKTREIPDIDLRSIHFY